MTSTASAPQRPDLRGPIRYLVWLARCQGRRIALGAFYGSAWMITLALPPYLLSRAIDDGLQDDDGAALWRWVGALFVVGVVNAWLAIGRHRTMTRVRLDANYRTTTLTVDHVVRLGVEMPERVAAGEVVAIGLGDVVTIAAALTVTGPGLGALVAYALVGVLLWTVCGLLAVVVLLGVPVLAVLIGPLLGRLLGVQSVYRTAQSGLTERLIDVVQGLRVLNAFGGKTFFAQRYRAGSADLRDRGYRVAGVTSWISGLAVGLPAVFLAGVTWLAARMALDGSITVGQLVAVYGYAAMLVVPVSMFIEGGDQISRAVVAARRLLGFLTVVPRYEQQPHTAAAPASAADLHDPVTGLRVAPGRMMGVVSTRAADTVAALERLAGLAAPAAVWGGVAVTDIAPADVRARILLADNDAMLFAGSLRDVLLGRSTADDDAIATAVHACVADDVVLGLPHGLDGRITQGGTNLSGGQRQRVRLARAMLADPEILLAVEPTSALDALTEAAVADRIRELRLGRATVLATSSPLVLSRVDEVAVIIDGEVAATGSHAQLLATHESYRNLVSRDDLV